MELDLSILTERERMVYKLREGLIDGRRRTPKEVGKIYDVGIERIRQIHRKAVKKLLSRIGG